MSRASQALKMKAEKTCFFTFNQRSKQEIKCLKAFLLGGAGGGGIQETCFDKTFLLDKN